MENKHFERELPVGYREVFSVDAKEDKSFVAKLTLASFLLTAVFAVPLFFLKKISTVFDDTVAYFLGLAAFCVIMVGYIVCHELTHGAVYKLLTHEKLTFGFTLTVAYCGVPHIYVYRKTAFLALIAPFALFSLVFGGLTVLSYFLLPSVWFFVFGLSFAIHFGGCAGDLYDTVLLLCKLRDPRLLMNDTGPKQSFYLPEEESKQE